MKPGGTQAGQPSVSVSLVTFNGMRWLPGCLASAKAQTLGDFELLVLDNASTDGSVEWLREQLASEPRMKLTESARNLGYAAAHNRHIFAARGEYVLLLNQDVELDAEFLRRAVGAFDGRPNIGAVQGRLRRLGQDRSRLTVLDSTGLEMHRDRRVVARRQGDAEGYRDLVPGPVWGVDGPAPVYRRSALIDSREPRTGGGWEVLDEDFFMYKEDVDLAWRLRLLGWQTWYRPSVLAWHGRGAGRPLGDSLRVVVASRLSVPRWIQRISWRNHRLMQFKNESPADLVRDLPYVVSREIASLLLMAVTDPPRLSGIVDLIRLAPSAARKRAPKSPSE